MPIGSGTVFVEYHADDAWGTIDVRIPAKADTDSDDGGHRRSVATQAG
jgi:hypothetical protein